MKPATPLKKSTRLAKKLADNIELAQRTDLDETLKSTPRSMKNAPLREATKASFTEDQDVVEVEVHADSQEFGSEAEQNQSEVEQSSQGDDSQYCEGPRVSGQHKSKERSRSRSCGMQSEDEDSHASSEDEYGSEDSYPSVKIKR